MSASASRTTSAASVKSASPNTGADGDPPSAERAAPAASQASVHSGGSGSGSGSGPGSERSSGSSSAAGGSGADVKGGHPAAAETQKPRVSIKTPSMEATKADAAATSEEEDEDDPYALAEERHRELRKRLLYLTQPRASILSERSDPRAAACEQRSLISQYLRQRDPRLFISSQRRAVRSFLPPLFRAQFTAAATPQRTTGSRRRLPEQTLENQRLMEREYSSKKHRMQAEQLLESRIVQERCQLPMLGRAGAHCHRSELRHNFCIDVLERGCHQAHAEMYRLLRRDVALKSARQPPPPLLQDTLPKLQRLKQCLVDMEEATRRHDYMSAYGAANDLAFFFLKERADLWLASHFFEKCLEFGKKIEDDGKMRESEAHCNVGIMEFFDDNIDSALSHLERFRRLSYKQVWETADGYSYYRYSCLLLQDVYLSQAVAAENDDLETAFKLYLRASVMANQAANMQAEAMAQYNLGEIQEKMGNWQNALRRYEAYLRLSDKLLNFTGVCTGCFKIAKCHEAMGKLPLAVDNLKRSEHIARGQHLDDEIVRASSELGHIYLSMGKNDLAFRQFMEAYHYVELSESVANDHSYVASAMVGISSASRLLPEFAETVYCCRPEEMARLLQWKTARVGMHVEEPPGPKWY